MTAPRAHSLDGGWILEAPGAPTAPRPLHFEPESLRAEGRITGSSTGRHQAWFFEVGDLELVLRHYWRGGFLARLTDDLHLWSGLSRSRPYRELALLAQLRADGLPVPRPVGARILRRGPTYRADLVTVAIPHTRTFADAILEGTLDGAAWVEVGRTLRQFHEAGAHHADLNVRNILLDQAGTVWLIDWDKGRRRRPGGRWAHRTMARLHRSLSKEPELARAAEEHWPTLLRAWEAG